MHPGAIIRNILNHERLSATAAAKRIGIIPSTLNNVLQGRDSISPDMALRLSRFCGNSAQFWLRLQEQFDLWHRSCVIVTKLDKIERLTTTATYLADKITISHADLNAPIAVAEDAEDARVIRNS